MWYSIQNQAELDFFNRGNLIHGDLSFVQGACGLVEISGGKSQVNGYGSQPLELLIERSLTIR